MSQPPPTVDIRAAIDGARMSRTQVTVIGLSALVALLDGLDLQMIGLAAPAIASELHVSPASLGVVFSAALAGLGVGAFALGPLADKIGRKSMLVVSTLCFGVFTLAAATASSVTLLLVYRLLAGVGLGGAMPSFISLTSEFVPARRRAAVVGVLYAGVPLGGVGSSVLTPWVIQSLGWRWMFVIGGLVPLLIGAIIVVALPESITYLVARGAPAARIRRSVRRAVPGIVIEEGTQFKITEDRPSGVGIGRLFGSGRSVATILLWIGFFVVFMILATDTSWTPSLLAKLGVPVGHSATALIACNVGSVLGTGAGGWLMNRFGSRAVLPIAFVAGMLSVTTTGFTAPSLAGIVLSQGGVGLSLGCASAGVIALAAQIYPTAIRSTGVGWAMGMGRVGSFLGPLGIGLLLALAWTVPHVFLALGCSALVAAGCVTAIRPNRSVPVPITDNATTRT